MALSEKEQQQLNRIREAYVDLDQWRVRSWKGETPERGSELAEDDRITPRCPLSEFARQSLVSAVQHLNLARAALEAGQLFPSAHYTVLRGALVGGSIAVWMLSPTEGDVRQQRGLRVAYEWMDRAQQYYGELEPIADGQLPNLPQARAHLLMRRDQIRGLWASAAELTEKQPLIVTHAVESAAETVFGAESPKVKLLWREMSGDAHALGWPILVRSTDVYPVGGGMSEFCAGGDLELIANAFFVSYKLTKHGWSLFDRRCEGQ